MFFSDERPDKGVGGGGGNSLWSEHGQQKSGKNAPSRSLPLPLNFSHNSVVQKRRKQVMASRWEDSGQAGSCSGTWSRVLQFKTFECLRMSKGRTSNWGRAAYSLLAGLLGRHLTSQHVRLDDELVGPVASSSGLLTFAFSLFSPGPQWLCSQIVVFSPLCTISRLSRWPRGSLASQPSWTRKIWSV